MIDIMPDAGLVAHEWSTHGTCSGLDAESYFKLIRRAFTSLKLPERFVDARENFSIIPEDVKRDFVQANPHFSNEEMTARTITGRLTRSVCRPLYDSHQPLQSIRFRLRRNRVARCGS